MAAVIVSTGKKLSVSNANASKNHDLWRCGGRGLVKTAPAVDEAGWKAIDFFITWASGLRSGLRVLVNGRLSESFLLLLF